jgi:hypothetical protein
MIVHKIDVTLIDKTALFVGKAKPDGRVPKYLDCALHENKDGPDKFGNHGFITQSLSKERRDAGERGPIIGNWRDTDTKSNKPKTSPAAISSTPRTEDDDVPF